MIRVTLVTLCMLALGSSGHDGPTVLPLYCYDGSLSQLTDGMVVHDNRTAKACGSDNVCVKYEISTIENTTHGLFNVATQSGICAHKFVAEHFNLCEAASNYTGIKFASCNTSTCNTTGCNAFREPSHCPKEPENDINILPNCTMREVLRDVQTCMEPLARGFPFRNQEMCLSAAHEVVGCVARTAVKCLNSSCFTVLDIIPELRGHYRNITKALRHVHGAGGLMGLVSMLGGNGTDNSAEIIIGMVMEGMCPMPGNAAPMFTAAEVMSLIGEMQNPVCDSGFLRDLAGRGMWFANRFQKITTHQEACVAFNHLARDIETMIKNRCNLDALAGVFIGFVPQPLRHIFAPTITKAVTIVLEMLDNIKLPDCGVVPPVTRISCERYHHSSRGCDQRKGWFCDFAKWRVEMVTDFFIAYGQWAENNFISLDELRPECRSQVDITCANHESRRFMVDVGGCPFFYCADHDYTNSAAVRKQWLYDSMTYRKILYFYQKYNHNTC